jgi:membrane fusion protein (multidrug efflux system)
MKRSTLITVLVVAGALAAGGWMLRPRPPAPAAPDAAASAAPADAPIEFAANDIVAVAPSSIARTIPLTGTLRPVEQTVVKAKVPGEIRELRVREGMAVKRGQVIGRIDPIEFEVRVRERDAQLKSTESQVAQARRTVETTRQLKERNFVSQSALDQAQSALDVAIGNRDAAAAQLALARKSVSDADLVAPIDGIVAERFAQPGEKLPVDGRVMSIVDLSRMEIEAPVPAAEVGAVRTGQEVVLKIEGVAQPQVGRIARIAPATLAGTRSVQVWIALDNRDPAVRAGLFAQGRLAVESRADVLTVPLSAVRDAGGRSFVYAIAQDRLVEREVRLGLRDDTGAVARVEVLAGLAPGERIVAANLGALRVGAPVRIAAARAADAPAPTR